MPSFNTEVPHELGRDEATQKLKHFLEKVARTYQAQVSELEEKWIDNQLVFSFKTYGFKIEGDLTVEENHARIQAKLPFAAVPFRGKIEQSITSELGKVLV